MTLPELHEVFKEAKIPVMHYKARQTGYPYIVWQERSSSYNYASGKVVHELIPVTASHLTKKEWDPTLDEFKLVLLKKKINFTTVTIWYEDDELIETIFNLAIWRELEV